MKRKLPTILIMLVMVLMGAMYWVDLSYYTSPATGFLLSGTVWMRYAVLALPLVMCLLGISTVGASGIAALRVKNLALGVCFTLAGVLGVVFGLSLVFSALSAFSVYSLCMGLLCTFYGVWMALCAIHFFTQATPAPTASAVFGVAAAMPFFVLAISRVMVRPTSLHRIAPLVSALSAILAILWFSLFLRSLYVAMPQRRARGLYFTGLFLFLFATCLELPGAVHQAMLASASFLDVAEAAVMGTLGLAAGCLSISIAGMSDTVLKESAEDGT